MLQSTSCIAGITVKTMSEFTDKARDAFYTFRDSLPTAKLMHLVFNPGQPVIEDDMDTCYPEPSDVVQTIDFLRDFRHDALIFSPYHPQLRKLYVLAMTVVIAERDPTTVREGMLAGEDDALIYKLEFA